MAPRIVRPRTDSPLLPVTLTGAAVSLALGWFMGAWVFKPSSAAPGAAPGEGDDTPITVAAAPDAAAPVRVAPPDASAAPAAPSVPVRLTPGILSGCGDGEEMNLPGGSCDTPAGLEPALRARLQSLLGACPSAASAARDPSKALSLGLRVDFQRRRVVSLLGRSSAVPDKVSYVPCANAGLASVDELWRIQAAHPRYLYFFTARFGPLRAPAPDPDAAPAPTAPETPAPAAPAAPQPAEDAGAPDPSLPTPADMLRMRAIDHAAVTWPTAIVRETPRTGPVVARLPQNTPVDVVDRRGNWYGIRWERTHVGWTYGDAIGQAR